MTCNPKPEATCGTLINDTCVVYTGPWPSCFSQEDSCHRQSEFNLEAGTMLCDHEVQLIAISHSLIGGANPAKVTGLVDCDPHIDRPDKSIKENFQILYDQICHINIDWNLPVIEGSLVIPTCIQNPCDPSPFTLGTLVQAMLDQICDTVSTTKIYRAVLTQSGSAAPTVHVLENNVGNIVWTRGGSGLYSGTLASTFTINKTFLLVGLQNVSVPTSFYRTSSDVITLSTSSSDGVLNETAVEIRIYS